MIGQRHDRRGRARKLWDGCLDYAGSLVAGAAGGLRDWGRSRHFRYLLEGLPALLAGTALGALALHIALTPRGELVARYQHEARRALQDGDYPAAQECYERLALLGGDEPDVRYGLALVAEAQGQHERARALFDTLAPLDRQGYGLAHLWQAKRLLAAASPSPQDVQAAELHLRRTLQGLPDELEAHAQLGQLYLATNRLEQAETHLLKAVDRMPGLRLRLARLYRAQDRPEPARHQAEQAVQFFRPQAEADLNNHQARLGWTDAAVLLEDFAGAVDILRPGLVVKADLYRPALAGVYGAWSDALGRDKARPGERLALLEQGLQHDPGHPALLQRLIGLAKAPGAEADRAQATLQRLLAQGKGGATLHGLLGLNAWERGRVDEARRHFEEAHRLAPQNDVVANNLAWALAHTQPLDLPRALALISAVLERRPNQPQFRDTQEKILAKMKTQEAQPDRVAASETEALAPEFFQQAEAPKKVEELDQAVASFRRQEYEPALDRLKEACKRHPALPPARLLLARLFLADNQLSQGHAHLDQAQTEHPDYPGVYLGFGALRLAERRPADAALHFERAAALARSGPWPDGQRRFFLTQAHAGQVAVAEGQNNWPAARSALAAWLELDPKNGKARQRLARALLELGQPADALKELERAARDDSALPPATVTLGWLYTRKGDLKKAAEAMEGAVRNDPDNPKVHLGMAGWLLQQGQAEQARGHADTAARLGLDSKELKLLRGLIARHGKDYAQAEGYFQAIHREAPEDFQASNQLALVLVEQADQAKQQLALRLAEANVRVYPRSAEARATLGRVYHRLGRLEEAERALQAAVPGGKASPEMAYYLGCVLADLGRTERAKKLLKAALEADGFFLFRKEAQERLDQLDNKP